MTVEGWGSVLQGIGTKILYRKQSKISGREGNTYGFMATRFLHFSYCPSSLPSFFPL